MKYLSPFHILPEGFKIENLSDEKFLKQARKLVLAEFELQGKTTILINNQEYDKDGILKYFEALEKDENLDFHAKIYLNKSLLSFLETGNIENYRKIILTIQDIKYQKSDDGFLDFITPYFTNHFNALFSKAVRQNDSKVLDILLGNEFPLAQKYEVTAFQSTYRWYHSKLKNINVIQESLGKKEFVSSKEIYLLIDLKFIETFNRLPTYFNNVRDLYAFRLYEIIVILNNELNRTSLARTLVDAGLLIKAESATMAYFRAATKVIDKDVKKEGKNSWIWLFVIFQAILIISRIATCNNSSSSNNYNLTPSEIYNTVNKNLSDSILNRMEDNFLQEEIKENMKYLDTLRKRLELNNQ